MWQYTVLMYSFPDLELPTQDGGVEVRALIFCCKNSKIKTHCWITIDRRMLDLTKKKIPHLQGQRRNPSKTSVVVKSHLESNPIPTSDAWRAQTKLAVHQETPQRLNQTCLWVFECLLWRYGCQQWSRHSGCSKPGCGISPLGGACH